MSELLWLLLPIAAASGWLAAQRSLSRTKEQPPPLNLSLDYFKGLNYLLNEQPDKAIDVFINLIDVDSDTVETHLALGTLFRRRGEVNRAILIHQNLTARTTLSLQQRTLAIAELAQDYYRAGLLDRAEDLFQILTDSPEHRIYAYHQLIDIYQQEHDWEKAIDHARKLAAVSEEQMDAVIAQYYCELAETFKQQGNNKAVLEMLQQALTTDPNCVRASLLEGYFALEFDDKEQAICAFKRIEQQNPIYLSEVIELLQNCYSTLGRQDEFVDYLHHVLKNYGGITAMIILAKILTKRQGEWQATDFIIKQLHKRPSIRGLDYLIDLALSKAEVITHEHLLLLKDMTMQLLKDKPIYQCSHCGFTGKSLHWQCPSCKQWNTVKPIQGIEVT